MSSNSHQAGFHPFSQSLSQWFHRRQLRALEEAYCAAQQIKALEEQYFRGEAITQTPNQPQTVYDYVRSLRDRQLLRIRLNLTQLRLSSFLLNRPIEPEIQSNSNLEPANGSTAPPLSDGLVEDNEDSIIEKLSFIDTVINRYRASFEDQVMPSVSAVKGNHSTSSSPSPSIDARKPVDRISADPTLNPPDHSSARVIEPLILSSHPDHLHPHTSGWFGNHLSIDFRRRFDPNYEQKIVQELRIRRKQDRLALQWLMILLLIPLFIQMLAKNFVFEPILGSYSDRNPTRIELSNEIQSEFLAEFSRFKEELEIREFLGLVPPLSPADRQEQLEEHAASLWRESRERELNGFKNILSDGVALLGFVGLVFFNRDKLAAIKTFSNRTFLSLSDPAKVFLFILVTDMFVGFHSAEGWAVLLEGFARHFGVPESRTAINTFIATVPVILDACIKFWIFSYLTRFSPSASAIYERMNT